MIRIFLSVFALFLFIQSAFCRQQNEDPLLHQKQQIIAQVQASQIDGNVPDKAEFDRLFRRDINTFVRTHGFKKSVKVDYRLLRQEATQSGVAYPKFYAWITLSRKGSVVEEGAVRAAAIDKQGFEFTNYVNVSKIRASPEILNSIFPEKLIPAILQASKVPGTRN